MTGYYLPFLLFVNVHGMRLQKSMNSFQMTVTFKWLYVKEVWQQIF